MTFAQFSILFVIATYSAILLLWWKYAHKKKQAGKEQVMKACDHLGFTRVYRVYDALGTLATVKECSLCGHKVWLYNKQTFADYTKEYDTETYARQREYTMRERIYKERLEWEKKQQSSKESQTT